MKNMRITIRIRLFSVLILSVLVFIVVFILNNKFVNDLENYSELQLSLNDIQFHTQELRKAEKDYLSRELINQAYFKSGESKYLVKFKSGYTYIQQQISRLEKNKHVIESNISFSNISSDLELYIHSFEKVEKEARIRGYEEFGVVGDFRTSVHGLEEYIAGTLANDKLHVLLLSLRRNEKDYLLRKDLKYQEEFHVNIKKLVAELDKQNLSVNQYTAINDLINMYANKFDRVVAADMVIGLNENSGLLGELRNAVHQLEPEIQKLNTILATAIEENKARNRMVMGLIIGLMIIALGSFIFSMIRYITATLRTTNRFVKQIGDGELYAKAPRAKNDEFGLLSGYLDGMRSELLRVIENVMTVSNHIASASEQISSSSQQVSQGAAQQASSAEEVSSVIKELNTIMDQNAESAKETENIARNATDGVKEGKESTDNAVLAMNDIAARIRIVNDIAFQTNILALNAAVEAARAGQHGKGFAVVAAEVRKLAERSKIAADEVDTISRSGVEVSEKSGKQLEQIVPEIERTASLIKDIAESSLEQSSGASMIYDAVQELSQVTQQNAATSEEMASSAEELASQAQNLKEVVSYFKIDQKKDYDTKPQTISEFNEQERLAGKNNGFNLAIEQEEELQKESDFELETRN